MATATDNFDSYSDGDLNTNNGGSGFSAAWSGSTSFDVQGTTTQSGAKAVQIASSENGEVTIDRSLTTPFTSGTLSVYLRRTGGNNWRDGAYVILRDNSADVAGFYLHVTNTSTGAVGATLYSGGTTDVFENGTLSADTWHLFEAEFDCDTDEIRARVDGGAWSSWLSFASAATDIDQIRFFKGNINGGTHNVTTDHYWDQLNITNEAGGVTFLPKVMVY